MDEGAAALGLRRGQGLADARAAHPGLDIVPADADADRRLLEQVADWCDRYTPLVALDAPDGLYLDITGCAHLFGGEGGLARDLLTRLKGQGLAVRAGLASTPGTAWAIARFGARRAAAVAAGNEAGALAPLPLAALRLDSETLAGLDKLGLKTVGQLSAMARAPLARRFGRGVLMRLDQALGQAGESLSPRLPVPDFTAERQMAEPVSQMEDVERILAGLAASLEPRLARHGLGARALVLTLFRVDGAVSRVLVKAGRPLRDPAAILRLFREKLKGMGDELDAGFGYDLLRLGVVMASARDDVQESLTGREDAGEGLALLVDRIAARLGEGASGGVLVPQAAASHVPERALTWLPATALPAGFAGFCEQAMETGSFAPQGERPVRLFNPPEPVEVIAGLPEDPPVRFRWRRVVYRVVRAEGPERLAGQWWERETPDEADPRDYYRVEDEDGRRYWLFRAGLYEAGGQVLPRWFMHGLFA